MGGARKRHAPTVAPTAASPDRSDPVASPRERAGDPPRIDVRQLISTANELLALAADLEGVGPRGEDSYLIMDSTTVLAMARAEYRRRRNRGHFFDGDALFGEPAWDMLLDLFIAGLEGKQVPVTSACIGACVPTTTALRWLALLEQRGLLCREPDPTDARRAHISLSDEARQRMEQYFHRVHRATPR